jgi:hypothetical protein
VISPTERASQCSSGVVRDRILDEHQAPPTLDDYTRALAVIHAEYDRIRLRHDVVIRPILPARDAHEAAWETANTRAAPFLPVKRGEYGWHCDTLVDGKIVHDGDPT